MRLSVIAAIPMLWMVALVKIAKVTVKMVVMTATILLALAIASDAAHAESDALIAAKLQLKADQEAAKAKIKADIAKLEAAQKAAGMKLRLDKLSATPAPKNSDTPNQAMKARTFHGRSIREITDILNGVRTFLTAQQRQVYARNGGRSYREGYGSQMSSSPKQVRIDLRDWTSKSGKYMKSARFLDYLKGLTMLATPVGDLLFVETKNLSSQDRTYITKTVQSLKPPKGPKRAYRGRIRWKPGKVVRWNGSGWE